MMAKFTIPAGSTFDVRTGQWTLPFYNRLLADPDQPYGFADTTDGKVFIFQYAEEPVVGQPSKFSGSQEITYEEFEALNPMFSSKPGEDSYHVGHGIIGTIIHGRDDFKLKPGERGLVLRSGIERTGTGEVEPGPGFDAEELRAALLLWDRLDWVKNNIIQVPETAETQFLEGEGVLFRSNVHLGGRRLQRQALVDLDIQALRIRDAKDPGRWSLGRGATAELHEAETDTGSLLVQLHGLIRLPDAEVPLEEVLAFREKRRPELLALREEIDRAYERVLAAVDQPRAWVTETDALTAAIEAQRKVASEARWSRLGSLAGIFKVENLGPGATAAVGALIAGTSLTQAIAAGVAGLGVSAKVSLGKRDKVQPSPYRYVIAAEKEFHGR